MLVTEKKYWIVITKMYTSMCDIYTLGLPNCTNYGIRCYAYSFTNLQEVYLF